MPVPYAWPSREKKMRPFDANARRCTSRCIHTATLAAGSLAHPCALQGKNVTLDSSKTFSTFVQNTVRVVVTQRATAAANGGFAH